MKKIEVTETDTGRIRILFTQEDYLDGKILTKSEAQALLTKLQQILDVGLSEE